MRVLIASRHPEATEWTRGLEAAGYAVDLVSDPTELTEHLWTGAHDALVVDHDLANVREHRAMHGAAVIVVTEEVPRDQRRRFLQEGAMDVMTPPFPAQELQLRISIHLLGRTDRARRRSVELGGVRFDRVTRRIEVDGSELRLSPTALCIFDHLVAYRDRLSSEGELLERCWNAQRDPFTNPLRSHIYRLRKTFAGRLRIRYVPQRGYQLEMVSDDGERAERSNGTVARG